MVAISRCLASLALVLAGADGARIARKRGSTAAVHASEVKVIADVPIYNYHRAYGGESLAQIPGGASDEDWIVVMKPGTTDAQIESLCELPALERACKLKGHPTEGGVPFFEFRGAEETLKLVLEASLGAARFVEPNLPVYKTPELEPEEVDPESGLWGLDRIGAPSRANGGKGVHIYIMDSGVRKTHTDFGGRVVPTLDYTRFGDIECKGRDFCAGDLDGHGSHCAGVAGGEKYGVAPKATIHSVKVLGRGGVGEGAWICGGLDWISAYGARPAVASMSIGGPGNYQPMREAIDVAVAAGVTVVVAAGNENLDACDFSPSFVVSAITVGSTNNQDQRSFFSNFGSCTNIWGPGTAIRSAGHRNNEDSSQKSGTSMACPAVAGGAALLLEKAPDLSPAQVLQSLHENAYTNGISGLEAGDTNKFLFVGASGPPPTPVTSPPTPAPGSRCSAGSSGPDRFNDCRCDAGLICHQGWSSGCPSSWPNQLSDDYFLVTCDECACF